MKVLHLTDEEIQQYALDSSGSDISITGHVSSCGECKNKVMNYRLLFASIQQQPQAVFDFNLAELVVAQLPSSKPIATPDNSLIYVFVLTGIALAAAVLYYFRVYIVSLFTSIAPLLIYLTATTIITLAVILSIDMYRNYQRKMRTLDFY